MGIKLILSWKETQVAVCLDDNTIQRQIDAGKFPAPVAISKRRSGFRLTDLYFWQLDPSTFAERWQARQQGAVGADGS